MNQLMTICFVLGLPLIAVGLHSVETASKLKSGPPFCGCYPCDYQNNQNGENWEDNLLGVGCSDLQAMLQIEIAEGESCTSVMAKVQTAPGEVKMFQRMTSMKLLGGLWFPGWTCPEDLVASGTSSVMVTFNERDNLAVGYKQVMNGIRFILAPGGVMKKTGNVMCGCSACNFVWNPGFEAAGKLITEAGCNEVQDLLATSMWDGDACSVALEDIKASQFSLTRIDQKDLDSRYYNPLAMTQNQGTAYAQFPMNVLMSPLSSCPADLKVVTGGSP